MKKYTTTGGRTKGANKRETQTAVTSICLNGITFLFVLYSYQLKAHVKETLGEIFLFSSTNASVITLRENHLFSGD